MVAKPNSRVLSGPKPKPALTGWKNTARMAPDGPRWLQMAPDAPRWLEMAPDGPKWPQMGPDATRWPQMAPDGPRWLQMAPNGADGPRCPQMAPDGLRWPQIKTAWWGGAPERGRARQPLQGIIEIVMLLPGKQGMSTLLE